MRRWRISFAFIQGNRKTRTLAVSHRGRPPGFFIWNMATATLKPQRYATTEDDDFVVFDGVPVWKEHTNRDGVEFGPAELQKVCDRCNERIEDTGDYPTVILRHTDDEGERDPKVVGFAGPFKIGTIGKTNPKAAILTQLRIFKEDAQEARRYPRLSVEYWGDEDDPTNGYFDPIALLGAETPELDLGIRYEKARKARYPVRYSRLMRYDAAAPAFPGGSNAYIPGGTNLKKKHADDDADDYAKETDPMPQAMEPEAINQIVDAVLVAVDARIDEKLAELRPEPPIGELGAEGAAEGMPGEEGLPGEQLPPEMAGQEVPGEVPTGEEPLPGEEAQAGEEGPALEAPPEPAASNEPGLGSETAAAEAVDEEEAHDRGEKDREEDEELAEHYAKMCKYDADGDGEGMSSYMKECDEGRRKAMYSHIEKYEKDEERKGRMLKYMADALPSENVGSEKAKEILKDGEVHGHPLTEKQRGMFGAAAGRSNYQKERQNMDRYQKLEAENKKLREENATLRQKYQKEATDRRTAEETKTTLEQRVDKLEASERRAVRYQKLTELSSQGYIFDVDDEMAEVASQTDDQFGKHCDRIVAKYQRAPIGRSIAIPKPSMQYTKGSEEEMAAKYSKRAKEIADEATAKGEHKPFAACFEQAKREIDSQTKAPAAAGV